MDKHQIFKQTNAFAMFNGLFFGLYCSAGFLCTVKGLTSGALSTLGLLITLSVPVMGCYFARKFERQVREDAPVTFGRAYLYSVLLYFYAAIVMALVAFGYFQWFDNGAFAESYAAVLSAPEMQDAMKQSGMDNYISDTLSQSGFSSVKEMLMSILPIDVALGMLNMNILAGVVLALPTALFGKSRRQRWETNS